MSRPNMEGFISLRPPGFTPPGAFPGREAYRERVKSALLGQHQVEVGAFDELIGLNSEAIHEFTRFANARVRGFVVHQDDFELEEMAQAFDPVEVDAGTPDQEESAVLADATDLSVGQRKRFTKCLG